MYIGYSRISTSDQSQNSLDNQLKYLDFQAKSLNEKFKGYSEIQSGKSFEGRETLSYILSKLKPNDILGVYDNSRLGRNTGENIQIAHDIQRLGAKLHLNGRFVNMNDPNDELSLSIESAISTYQRKNQNLKSRIGIDTKKAQGAWIFTSRLLGYRVENIRGNPVVSIIEEEADIIRFIFNKYDEGMSINKITKTINHDGYRTRNGKEFESATVRRYIHKPIYFGKYKIHGAGAFRGQEQIAIDKKDLVKSKYYEPIISEELFWSVYNSYRTVVRKHARQFIHRWSPYEISSIMKCFYCGKGYIHSYHKQRTGSLRANSDYVCRIHSEGCKQTRHTFRAEVYEKLFRQLVRIAFQHDDKLADFIHEKTHVIEQTVKELKGRKSAIKADVNKVVAKLTNIVDAVEQDGYAAVFKERMKELAEQKEALEGKLEAVEKLIFEETSDEESILAEYKTENLEQFEKATAHEKRNFYRKWIDKCWVRDDLLYVSFVHGVEMKIKLEKNRGRIIQREFQVEISMSDGVQGVKGKVAVLAV